MVRARSSASGPSRSSRAHPTCRPPRPPLANRISADWIDPPVLLDLPLEASSRWAGVYHPYPNPSASSASLSKPAAINPIHTAGSTFNPALRFGAGTAEGTLVGERAGGATASAGVGVSEGRNWLMLRLDRPAVLSESISRLGRLLAVSRLTDRSLSGTIHFGKLHRRESERRVPGWDLQMLGRR